MPAFQDMDDDDGPEFEYLEEPDFDDDDEEGHRGADIEQEPPDEAPTGRGGSRPGEAASRDRDGRNRGTGKGAVQTSPQPPPPPPLPATPRHRPRPKIVSARARLREQEERGGEEQGRRRAREDGGGGGVVDIEGDFRGGGTSAEKSGGGLEFPRRKRGRSNNQLGDGGMYTMLGKGKVREGETRVRCSRCSASRPNARTPTFYFPIGPGFEPPPRSLLSFVEPGASTHV